MLEVLFIGLSLGSILLVALGLAITYGRWAITWPMRDGHDWGYVTVLTGIWLRATFRSYPTRFM